MICESCILYIWRKLIRSTEDFLFPYGDENGDSRLKDNYAYASASDYVSEYIKVPFGFPMGYSSFYPYVYVSKVCAFLECGFLKQF